LLIYLDMCCLKRPFDDKSNARNRVESEAVLSILSMESDECRFVRSAALELENDQNPVHERASRVRQWLRSKPRIDFDPTILRDRVETLMKLGMRIFDALHVATAEHVGANVFVTTDDRLLAVTRRIATDLRVRTTSLLEIASELTK
jgi:predicted nucleic acid-binding protein